MIEVNKHDAARFDKKAQAAAKADFELHVALVRKQDGATASVARFRAWSEGADGLAKRLGGK